MSRPRHTKKPITINDQVQTTVKKDYKVQREEPTFSASRKTHINNDARQTRNKFKIIRAPNGPKSAAAGGMTVTTEQFRLQSEHPSPLYVQKSVTKLLLSGPPQQACAARALAPATRGSTANAMLSSHPSWESTTSTHGPPRENGVECGGNLHQDAR